VSAQQIDLERVIEAARAAGEVVLEVYERGAVARDKADGSPVTEADERAQEVIISHLLEIGDGVPIVAEEDAESVNVSPANGSFWLVDPLDGTKEFLGGNGEFTVNIALVDQGVPVLGVVLAPARGRLFAASPGDGALVEDADGRRQIAARQVPPEGLTIVSSRSHGDADALARFTEGRTVASSVSAGSSLKFCLVAAGEADVYPRFGRTMEWDTAAGDAVLRAAGGRVTDLDGNTLAYGKPGFENPHFLAWGKNA
jgi:3'(2'), 5'-bisphosphate nucleotidase